MRAMIRIRKKKPTPPDAAAKTFPMGTEKMKSIFPNFNEAYAPMRRSALLTLLAAMALASLQGCMSDSSDDGDDPDAKFPQTLFAAQEGSLVSFDLATGKALAGSITDIKAPTDMQALEDGTIIVNLSNSNEILALDGTTMLQKARMPSSGGTAVRPVHSFVTPKLDGRQYWMTLNDGSGTAASNSARFVNLELDSAKFLKPAGEVGLGIGHHKAAFSPGKARVVISNIGDCADIMSVFDFTDIGDIKKVSTLNAAGAGFDGSDKNHTCDQTKAAGITPSPHGCATAKGNAHALCNLTGNGVLVAVDLDAAVPAYKLIPTQGTGGGYTSGHPGGRYVYTLQGNPKEGAGGAPCQVGQVAVVDMQTDSLVKELPVLYKGPSCADSLSGTPAKGASVSHIFFAPDGKKAYINIASASADSASRVDRQVALDLSDPANPVQLPSIAIGVSFGSHGETLSGDGKWLVVANNMDGTVSVIDVAAGAVSRTLEIGNAGKTMATFGSDEGPGHQVGPFH
jgi:DNA-binding beta-propeller fold protein YncE